MQNEYIFSITQNDISNAKPCSPRECLIQKTISRYFPGEKVFVGLDTVRIYNSKRAFPYKLCSIGSKLRYNFDNKRLDLIHPGISFSIRKE